MAFKREPKHCTKCGELHKDCRRQKGLCLKCYEKQPSRQAKKNEWYYANKELCLKRAHESKLRTRYGITSADYEKMLLEQDGRCAICRDCPEDKSLFIDHSHVTGKVRGLLCTRCNFGLGYFRDNPVFLEEAIYYLRKTKENK